MFSFLNEYLIFRHHINFSMIPTLLSEVTDKESHDYLSNLNNRKSIFSSLYSYNENESHFFDYTKVISLLNENNAFFEEPFSYCYEQYPYNFLHYIFGNSNIIEYQYSKISELEEAFDNCGVESNDKLKYIRESLFINEVSIDELAAKMGCSGQTIYNYLDKAIRLCGKKLRKIVYNSEFSYSLDWDNKRQSVNNEFKEKLSFAMFNKGILPISIQNRIKCIKKSRNIMPKSIINLSIDELDLTVRSTNALKRSGIETVDDIVNYGYDWLVDSRNKIGKKTFDELTDKLMEFNINLEMIESYAEKVFSPTEEKIYKPSMSLQSLKDWGLSENDINILESHYINNLHDIKMMPYDILVEKVGKQIAKNVRDQLNKRGYIYDNYGICRQGSSELIHNSEIVRIQSQNEYIPIDKMDLSVRSFNCLKRAGINTLYDLLQIDREKFFQIRNLGMKSKLEVIDKLEEIGYELSECGFVETKVSSLDLDKLYEDLDSNQETKLFLLVNFLNYIERIDAISCLNDKNNLSIIKKIITKCDEYDYNSATCVPILSDNYFSSIFGDDDNSSQLSDEEKEKFINFVIDKYFPDNFDSSEISSRLYKSLRNLGYFSLQSAVMHSEDVTTSLKTSSDLLTQIEFNNIINKRNQKSIGTKTYILSVSRALLSFIYKNHIESFSSLVLAFYDDYKHCSYLTDSVKNEIETIMNDCNINKPTYNFDLYNNEISQNYNEDTDYEVEVVRYEKSTYSGGFSGQTVYITVKNKTRKNIKLSVNDIYLIQENQQIKRNYWLSGYVLIDEKIPPRSLKTAAAIFYDSALLNDDLRYSNIGVTLTIEGSAESDELLFSYNFSNEKWHMKNINDILF